MAYNNYMNPYGYNGMYSNPQMPVNNLQMSMPNVVQQPVIKGRYASSLDEVRVAQIDFDGSKTYFVCPAINIIYAKSIDMNGNSLIESYVLDRGDAKNNPLDDKLKVDKFYPSSQLCHCCGYKNTGTKDLSVRKWICPECGSVHDRDVNASINILNEGLRVVGA